ncbi:MAG: GGDEF domain-containing protein [Gammaproteobacteria bacterium]|nr:GGDEF domain-containing protein [Gammaproteobacteria bacterium]
MDIQQLLVNKNFFEQAPLFTSVVPGEIAHYLEECSQLRIKSGEVLLTPDSRNAYLYVIIEGTLEVRLESPERTPLTLLSCGECVGEMSVIERRTPSAYVMAAVDSVVLAIAHDTLWAMVGANHAIARNLLIILSGRIRTDNAIIADSAVIIRHFQKKSFTDALTGLHNRRWLREFFSREIARCQMNEDAATLALLDVDNFRTFNNTFGHLVGDHALGVVTRALIANFRSNDLIARYGGDEFLVLLPETSLAEARKISERMRKAVYEKGLSLAGAVTDSATISVSIGIAQMDNKDNLDDLITKADAALYRAKDLGRNRVSD